MILKPLTKKDGTVYTNVELIKIYYDKLKSLRDGQGAKTEKERQHMEDNFYRICGGSQNAGEVMAFMEQIVNTPDEMQAQRLFERGLIPVIK